MSHTWFIPPRYYLVEVREETRDLQMMHFLLIKLFLIQGIGITNIQLPLIAPNHIQSLYPLQPQFTSPLGKLLSLSTNIFQYKFLAQVLIFWHRAMSLISCMYWGTKVRYNHELPQACPYYQSKNDPDTWYGLRNHVSIINATISLKLYTVGQIMEKLVRWIRSWFFGI